MNGARNQIKVYEDKLKQLTDEIACKDDQLMIYKTELQNTQEKFKIKGEEVYFLELEFIGIFYKKYLAIIWFFFKMAKYEIEIHNLTQKCQYLTDETRKLENALERSRDNGERLHKESELVIANVNSWVNEQRYILQYSQLTENFQISIQGFIIIFKKQ